MSETYFVIGVRVTKVKDKPVNITVELLEKFQKETITAVLDIQQAGIEYSTSALAILELLQASQTFLKDPIPSLKALGFTIAS